MIVAVREIALCDILGKCLLSEMFGKNVIYNNMSNAQTMNTCYCCLLSTISALSDFNPLAYGGLNKVGEITIVKNCLICSIVAKKYSRLCQYMPMHHPLKAI